jgi:eukaryotic-like serine/threonine-protein kinase
VFKFLTHRHFLLNLFVMICLAALLIWGFFFSLGMITKHGEYLTVPDVLHKSTKESIKLLESKGFTVQVQDSVYTDTAKLGTVLKQFPEGSSTVKVNRLVMLTVNRVTLPLVDMPALISKSKEYALELLERSHLKLEDTIYKPSYMMGAIIEQTCNGQAVAAGAKIPWGSRIVLVIGSGLSDREFVVPSLIGLTFKEAKLVIEQNGLLLASQILDPGTSDTANAYVYKQNPPSYTEDKIPVYIRAGQVMDIWGNKEMKIAVDTVSIVQEPDSEVKKEEDKKEDKKDKLKDKVKVKTKSKVKVKGQI